MSKNKVFTNKEDRINLIEFSDIIYTIIRIDVVIKEADVTDMKAS